MPAISLPTPPSRSALAGTAGGNPVSTPSTSTTTAPSKSSRQAAPDMPEARPVTSQPTTSAVTRQRSAAASLQVALLGRELDWKDKARMRSGAAVESLQAGLERQAHHAGATIESIVTPVVNFLENAGDTTKFLAAASVAGTGAAAFVAANTETAASLVQQWKTGADMLSPALVPAAALAVGVVSAATAEYLSPSKPLRELERIAEGPHARQLADVVARMHDAIPEPAREAMRPVLLEALPALERMAQGPHASQMLALAQELLGTGTDRAAHEQLSPTLLATFNALAGPHAPAVSQLIRALCPPSVGGVRTTDAGTLAALAEIAAGPHAAAALDFVSSQLAACPEGAARADLQRPLTAALPVLAALAHGDSYGSTRVLRTFQRMVSDERDDAKRGELRLALLDKLPAFAQLFSQSAVDARFTALVAFKDYRMPFNGRATPEMRRVANAASYLSANKPANPLNALLGLSTPKQALEFWLKKADA